MKKILAISSLGLSLGWIWYKSSLDASKARNPLPSTASSAAADQDSVSTKTPDREEFIVETRKDSPAHFLTKIESFSLLSEYGFETYETGEFEAGGYKWRLLVYPNGSESQDEGNHISVYLAVADTSSLPVDWEFSAIFTIFLYNQISDNYLCYRVNVSRFHTIKSKWGFPKFMSKKALRDQSSGYLVEDTIVLGAEVYVMQKQRIIESVTLLKPTDENERYWKIVDFSKLEAVWVSEEFSRNDLTWKMVLYPNGDFKSEGDGDFSSMGNAISLCLVCVSADTFTVHQKVKVEFNMRIEGWSKSFDHDSGKLSHWFTSSSKCCGQSAFISLAKLRDPENGFLVDDCCTLQLEIIVQIVVQ